MGRKFRVLYSVLAIAILSVMTIGATYAYWVATTASPESELNTESTIYRISMKIDPLYSGFSFIPMNDEYTLKAIRNQCKDKYDRGACAAYTIRVYDYNEDLDYISGYMDIMTNNMTNLSYMMFELSDIYEEESCVKIQEENYCVAKEATPMGNGQNLSLGDAYNVAGKSETKLLLLMWLTNLNESQNEFDIGSFNATVTIQAGSGGEIKGTIASSVQIMDDTNDNVDEKAGE